MSNLEGFGGLAFWLWRFTLWRLFVVVWCQRGLPGARWLVANTPFLVALRDYFLGRNDYFHAAECLRELDRVRQA